MKDYKELFRSIDMRKTPHRGKPGLFVISFPADEPIITFLSLPGLPELAAAYISAWIEVGNSFHDIFLFSFTNDCGKMQSMRWADIDDDVDSVCS